MCNASWDYKFTLKQDMPNAAGRDLRNFVDSAIKELLWRSWKAGYYVTSVEVTRAKDGFFGDETLAITGTAYHRPEVTYVGDV